MKKILIADASKASLVMTSEVFKDHFPGVHVLVARTSNEALEIAKREEQIDAFVVDYDLPDKDGAYTAAKIKKLFSIPVLITAFDRPDVQENIEKLCSAYDDCLSWLAKPVNPELVVSIAQRFIEGNYRTQRRIECMIPGIAELCVSSKESAKKAGSRKGAASRAGQHTADHEPSIRARAASVESVEKVCLPVMLEDCSVGGFKFRLMKQDIASNRAFKFNAQGNLNIDEQLTIFVPSFESIQTGAENVGYWLWGENKERSQKGESLQHNDKAGHKSKTLSEIKRSTRQNIGDKNQEGQAIKGKVIWATRIDGDDALIGVRSDNMVLSKKLFESVLLGDNKIKARKTLADAQKEQAKLRAEATAELFGRQTQKEKEFAREPAVPSTRPQPRQLHSTSSEGYVASQNNLKTGSPPETKATKAKSIEPVAKSAAKGKLHVLPLQKPELKNKKAPSREQTPAKKSQPTPTNTPKSHDATKKKPPKKLSSRETLKKKTIASKTSQALKRPEKATAKKTQGDKKASPANNQKKNALRKLAPAKKAQAAAKQKKNAPKKSRNLSKRAS